MKLQHLAVLALLVVTSFAIPRDTIKTHDISKRILFGTTPSDGQFSWVASLLKTHDISKRILFGTTASDGQFPWMASLHMRKLTQSSACGGSLIHVNWVLTAAHCLLDAAHVVVGLGSVNKTSKNLITQTSTQMYLHPNYKIDAKLYSFDIGLIYLPAAVTLSDKIKTIAIVPPGTTNFSPLLIMGWGKVGALDDKSPLLLWASVKLMDNASCKKSFTQTESVLCAVGNTIENASICGGDSGGPLVLDTATKYLVGVASITTQTCRISAYTLADKHRPWINSITKIQF